MTVCTMLVAWPGTKVACTERLMGEAITFTLSSLMILSSLNLLANSSINAGLIGRASRTAFLAASAAA